MSEPTKPRRATDESSTSFRPVLRNHVPSIVAQLQPSGLLPTTDQLNISIALPLRNVTGLDQLLHDLYDPAHPRFHQYLTAEQFAHEFGPSEQDYEVVLAFAKAHGLELIATHPNRTLVTLRGQVADIQRMFHFHFQLYPHPLEERLFYAPDAEPRADQRIPILRVNGLDDLHVRQTPLRFALQPDGGGVGPAAGSAPGGGLISRDFRNAYAPGVTLDGSGQAVGIYNGPHGFNLNDTTAYQQLAGIAPLVPVNKVLVDGKDYPPDNFSIEVTLDIEMAIAMAPGLSQVLVYEGADYVSTLNRMATDNIAKQLTSSWPTPPENGSADQVYKQFASQGQTFFCASGDAGAYYPTQPFSVDDPNITAVSGTQLTLSNAGDTWEAEVVWHDDVGSGGGGTMNHYALPGWQKNIDMSVNQGSTTSRNSPDVSMVATNIIIILNGNSMFVRGTSAASPLWAGYMALINEMAAQSGKQPLGFLNPSLYALGKSSGYTTYFHDITIGNNLTPWNTQPNNAKQYFAVPGYDLCTGWGTPTGSALIDAIGRDGPPQDLVLSASIEVTNDQDQRLDVFSLGQDKSVYHIYQTVPNGAWTPWFPLRGREIQQIVVARNADGRLELFALGGDRAIYHIWQTAPNGGWGQWHSLAGHDLQQIAIANNADGRLELFALGGDRAIYHIWQTTPNGNWGQWRTLAGHDLQQIVVANNADGRLELFALGGDRAIYHIWQTTPNGNWGQWHSLAGHDLQQIVVTNNADGRLELFALGGDRAIYHIWQTAPNGGWGQRHSLAGHDLQQIAIANNADGRLELFAIGGDHFIYHRWQATPNGDWRDWFFLR